MAGAAPSPAWASLFPVFLKIGASAFGGGIAALPVFEVELCRNRQWMTSAEVTECYAIAQSLPGVIIVNFAVLAGRQIAGLRGALLSALAVILPAFLVIWAFAVFFGARWDAPLVNGLLMGLRPAVIALLVSAAWRLGVRSFRNALSVLLFAAGLVGFLFLKIPLPVLILAAAGVGILGTLAASRKGRAP